VSYTGVGIVASSVARNAPALDHTGMVAARDIIRRNAIGQTVVVVPTGQPIPKGLDVEPGEAIPARRPRPRPRPIPNTSVAPSPTAAASTGRRSARSGC
jgi:hypothetical protein